MSAQLVMPGEAVEVGSCDEVGPGLRHDDAGAVRASVSGLLRAPPKSHPWVDHSSRRVSMIIMKYRHCGSSLSV